MAAPVAKTNRYNQVHTPLGDSDSASPRCLVSSSKPSQISRFSRLSLPRRLSVSLFLETPPGFSSLTSLATYALLACSPCLASHGHDSVSTCKRPGSLLLDAHALVLEFCSGKQKGYILVSTYTVNGLNSETLSPPALLPFFFLTFESAPLLPSFPFLEVLLPGGFPQGRLQGHRVGYPKIGMHGLVSDAKWLYSSW